MSPAPLTAEVVPLLEEPTLLTSVTPLPTDLVAQHIRAGLAAVKTTLRDSLQRPRTMTGDIGKL